ncbi:MAG TPA: hypothetical protein P5096_02255 [Patescibacteria group bacterium]|nr:hypothetical protein [Patescibacteria group bacterium]
MTIDNIKLFFAPAYLFNTMPGYDMKLAQPFVALFGIMVILALVSFIMSRKFRKKPVKHIWILVYNWFSYVGLVGLFLLFCRYEGVAYLSMRFLLFLWLVFFVLWGFYILWFRLKPYKKIVKEAKEKDRKDKYLRR